MGKLRVKIYCISTHERSKQYTEGKRATNFPDSVTTSLADLLPANSYIKYNYTPRQVINLGSLVDGMECGGGRGGYYAELSGKTKETASIDRKFHSLCVFSRVSESLSAWAVIVIA
jgi:hypothetical protein